jgi:hypothetical protein
VQALPFGYLLLGAGYAGSLRYLGLYENELSRRQLLWSALLVMLSLISFIIFEIYKTYVQSRTSMGRARILGLDAD